MRVLPTIVVVGLSASVTLTAASQSTPQLAPSVSDAIGKLSSFNYGERIDAARVVRRAQAAVVVPMLASAARSHKDEYVRYRALTLLSGFGGDTAHEVMSALMSDRNDRIRTVVFNWFEHHPAPAVLPKLVDAVTKEQSEFVRPALMRALAAQQADPRAREVLAPLVLRGADFFRGSVIEALGDFGGKFALADLIAVAGQEGPLQDDAITAIGRIGGAAEVPALAKVQQSVAEHLQPTVAASLCLLGRACDETVRYLKDTLAFAGRNTGYQPLLRGAVHGHVVLALRGRTELLDGLIDAGVGAKAESLRAPVALGVGLVALRQPDLILRTLEKRADLDAAVELVRDAFDMLSEDFAEEQFFVSVRKAYWAAAEGSPGRRVAETLIRALEF